MSVVECLSVPQMCLLGPIPPRTPGRSDAQVPSDAARGESKYGRIPFVYFYQHGVKEDATFGLLDIEIAVQRRGSRAFQFEIYCIGDGYQSGHGFSKPQPLLVELRAGIRTLAIAEWRYPDVLNSLVVLRRDRPHGNRFSKSRQRFSSRSPRRGDDMSGMNASDQMANE